MWPMIKKTPEPTLEELKRLALKYNRLTQERASVHRELKAKFHASGRGSLVVFDEFTDSAVMVGYSYESSVYGPPYKTMKVTHEKFTRE